MFEGGHRETNSNAASVGRKVPLKGRVFKIEISKVSGSALAVEICTGPHNRLLRRQHCSSLCSQSEGHEHVANMASALGHNLVGFSAHAWPPQYSPPHFASKVSYSASPQASAKCPRGVPCCDVASAMLFGSTPRRYFLDSECPPPMPVSECRPRCECTTSQMRSWFVPDSVVSRPRRGRASGQMR